MNEGDRQTGREGGMYKRRPWLRKERRKNMEPHKERKEVMRSQGKRVKDECVWWVGVRRKLTNGVERINNVGDGRNRERERKTLSP